MPKMDGFTCCQELKYHSDCQQIPVIFLTINKEDIHKLTGMGVGAEEYLGKPFDPKLLINTIKRLIKIKGNM